MTPASGIGEVSKSRRPMPDRPLGETTKLVTWHPGLGIRRNQAPAAKPRVAILSLIFCVADANSLSLSLFSRHARRNPWATNLFIHQVCSRLDLYIPAILQEYLVGSASIYGQSRIYIRRGFVGDRVVALLSFPSHLLGLYTT